MLTWYCHQASVQAFPRTISTCASTSKRKTMASIACNGIRLTMKAPACRTAAKMSRAQVMDASTYEYGFCPNGSSDSSWVPARARAMYRPRAVASATISQPAGKNGSRRSNFTARLV